MIMIVLRLAELRLHSFHTLLFDKKDALRYSGRKVAELKEVNSLHPLPKRRAPANVVQNGSMQTKMVCHRLQHL